MHVHRYAIDATQFHLLFTWVLPGSGLHWKGGFGLQTGEGCSTESVSAGDGRGRGCRGVATCLRARLEEWSSCGEHTVGGVWLPPRLPSGHCSSLSSRPR